jgi:hypothetical protein
MKNKLLLLLPVIFVVMIISLALGQSETGKPDPEADQSQADSGDTDEDGNQNLEPHDPFHLPKKKIVGHQMPGGVRLGQWHLTGILVGVSGERLAILNDRLVSEGDKVLGGQVDRIYPESVVIKGTFGTRELRILSFSSEGQGE